MVYIGVALFGLGRAGSIHFKNLVKNVRIDLKYLVEENVAVAEQFVVDYRLEDTAVLCSKDLDIVIKDTTVTACVITTPTETHEGIVMACLEAGKAVFCEKPLANTVDAIGKTIR